MERPRILRFDTPTGRLRAVAFLEGLSFVLLVFIAVPLKHMVGEPMAVRIIGPIHGLLFVWLLILLREGMGERGKSLGWAVRIGIASLLPTGTFFFDRQLGRDDEEHRANGSGPAG